MADVVGKLTAAKYGARHLRSNFLDVKFEM
jgi:hypothetical protein